MRPPGQQLGRRDVEAETLQREICTVAVGNLDPFMWNGTSSPSPLIATVKSGLLATLAISLSSHPLPSCV